MFQTGKPGPCALRREGRYAHSLLVKNGVFGVMLAVLACAAVAGPAPFAIAQCQYEVTAIITPDDAETCWPFPASNTFPAGMNSFGHVVGHIVPCAVGNERAFFWSKETGFTLLPHPPGVSQAYASDINDHGYIIGRHVFTGVGGKGFVYDPNTGEYTYLEPLHEGATATNLTSANAINNKNVVAGARVITEPGVQPPISNAVIWNVTTGEVLDLGVMNGPNSWAAAINDSGQASGTSGFQFTSNVEGWRFDNGQVQMLGSVPSGVSSVVNDMSGNGTLAGGTHLSGGPPGSPTSQGALWDGGKWNLLPLMPGATGGSAFAVNDLGQAAGRNIFPGSIHRATLWQHGIVHELVDLIADTPSNSTFPGATAMNNVGQILLAGSLAEKTVGYVIAPLDRSAADLNADCAVNFHDLLMLLKEWGPCKSNDCSADLTESGSVGVPDLLFLLSNWG